MIHVSYNELPEDVGHEFGIKSRELFADIMTGILNDPELRAIVERKLIACEEGVAEQHAVNGMHITKDEEWCREAILKSKHSSLFLVSSERRIPFCDFVKRSGSRNDVSVATVSDIVNSRIVGRIFSEVIISRDVRMTEEEWILVCEMRAETKLSNDS